MKNVVILFCLLCLVACSGSSTTSVGSGSSAVSGTITANGAAMSGVTVTLSGDATGTATTNSSGVFSFTGISNGRYTVTPSMPGYSFSPATRSVTLSNADATGQNFTAVVTTYCISGSITANGVALAGATVTLSGAASGTATTDASGNYSFTSALNGSYTLTAAKTGYSFTAASLSVTVNNADASGKNFVAVSGLIKLAKTGQTTSYAIGDDGDLEKGVASPSPRFTDNSNGTITDNLTGLVWLKNATCFGRQTWTAALTSANTLASGSCGLTDSSIHGHWRLPNITELESLVDLGNATGIALPAGHPFTAVLVYYYWSSSSYAGNTSDAWNIYMSTGDVTEFNKTDIGYVWPVRSGQ